MIICKQISPANYFVLKFISFEIKATLRCNIFQTNKKLHGCRHFISFKQQKEKKTSVTGKLRSTKYSLPYAVENSDVKVSHDLVLWVCFSFFHGFSRPKTFYICTLFFSLDEIEILWRTKFFTISKESLWLYQEQG